MKYCYVLNCNSRRKTPNISFHEFPSNLKLRQKWLENIPVHRDQICDRDTVCSVHFRPEDFNERARTRLKFGAVPSIFPEYPNSEGPKVTPPRTVLQGNIQPSKFLKSSDLSSLVTLADNNCYTSFRNDNIQLYNSATNSSEVFKTTSKASDFSSLAPTLSVANSNSDPPIRNYDKQMNKYNSATSSSEVFKTTSKASDFSSLASTLSIANKNNYSSIRNDYKPTSINNDNTLCNVARRTSGEILKELKQSKRERKHLHKTVLKLDKELEELRKENVSLTEKLKEHAPDKCPYKKALTDILNNRSGSSAVILEQLLNCKRKRPLWSPKIMKLYIALNHISPEAYSFVRESNLLNLPSRKTLKRLIQHARIRSQIVTELKNEEEDIGAASDSLHLTRDPLVLYFKQSNQK